jgi:phage-related protein
MADLVLQNKITQDSSVEYTENVVTASYGDGYSQRALYGLNAKRRKFSISWRGLDSTERTTLLNFWQSHGLYKAFTANSIVGIGNAKFRFTSPLRETNVGWYSNFDVEMTEVFEDIT